MNPHPIQLNSKTLLKNRKIYTREGGLGQNPPRVKNKKMKKIAALENLYLGIHTTTI